MQISSDRASSAPEIAKVDYDGLQHVDGTPPEHYKGPPQTSYAATYDQPAQVTLSDEKQDRRIGGLRPAAFWLAILCVGLVVIGASVGGAVGGTQSSKDSKASTVTMSPAQSATSSSASSVTLLASTTSTAPASPTSFNASSIDTTCNNGTSYEPPGDGGGSSVGGYTFQYTCGYDVVNASVIMQGWVASLEYCTDLCSSWNQHYYSSEGNGGPNCMAAIFLLPDYSKPPGNCFLTNDTVLYEHEGRDTAVLLPTS